MYIPYAREVIDPEGTIRDAMRQGLTERASDLTNFVLANGWTQATGYYGATLWQDPVTGVFYDLETAAQTQRHRNYAATH